MNRFLLFFLLIPIIGISQIQIGDKIEGDHGTDVFGGSVAMSADGNIIAVGATHNDNNGSNAGHVRVYENSNGTWTQIGDDVEGEAAGDVLGQSVALSAVGNIIAVGAPYNSGGGTNSGHVRVFENVDGNWTQIGDAINGDNQFDKCGWSVDLSADGNIVAIGSWEGNGNGNNSGQVRVFENINGVWTQIGSDMYGLQPGHGLGVSVALSSDGTILATGANEHPSSMGDSDYTMIFENVSGEWVQIGEAIYGDYNLSGDSVSLSADGNIVAIGTLNGGGDLQGFVRVYENIAGTWAQIGSDILGEHPLDQSGKVSLSADGTILAVGAPSSHLGGNIAGQVRIYKNVSNTWVQIGSDIDGEDTSDYFGGSVALSNEGTKLIVGAVTSITSTTKKGYVKVYDLTDALSTDRFAKLNFSIYPNPAKDIIHIALEDELQLENVIIYNNLGQQVKTVNQSTIDVSSLAKGLYFIEVHTNQGKASKKVVVE